MTKYWKQTLHKGVALIILPKIDLHTHTNHSDGTIAPNDLMYMACNKGLTTIAITDHDCITAIEQATLIGNNYGIEVIPGVEISTKHEDFDIHIVGLFIDHYNAELNLEINKTQNNVQERLKSILEKLVMLGMDVSFDEYKEFTKCKMPTRWHIASYLTSKCIVNNPDEAEALYLRKGKAGYVKRSYTMMSAKHGIELIHKAGGIAIWAHPSLSELSIVDLERFMLHFKQYGLDGIEAYYPICTRNDNEVIINLSRRHGLLLSGGSDYHGGNKPNIELGSGCLGMPIPSYILGEPRSYIYKINKRHGG